MWPCGVGLSALRRFVLGEAWKGPTGSGNCSRYSRSVACRARSFLFPLSLWVCRCYLCLVLSNCLLIVALSPVACHVINQYQNVGVLRASLSLSRDATKRGEESGGGEASLLGVYLPRCGGGANDVWQVNRCQPNLSIWVRFWCEVKRI